VTVAEYAASVTVEELDRDPYPIYARFRLARLLERFPGIRLDDERPPVFDGWEFRAPQHVHVRW